MTPRHSIPAASLLLAALAASSAAAEARNVVLVHGAATDGSSWRAIHDILAGEGYAVSVAQLPLTGLDEDVAALDALLAQQEGPVVLVGHSYGGAVITAAGDDPDVAALVYVAALQPDAGESVAELNASFPAVMDQTIVRMVGETAMVVDPARFREFVAADLPEADAAFLAHSQAPTSFDVFSEEATVAAWRDKPSFAVVATEDRTVNPDLQRWMYERSGATTTELAASHMVHASQPEAVAAVIMDAARAAE